MSTASTSDPPEKLPTDGLVASKYQLVRLIGRGGMGSVWEARHVSLGTKVAIKFVEVEEARSEEAKARFQNEARAAATIQSKHAIKVHDHGLLEDGRPYIVMELLLGESLERRIELRRRLPLDETARIVQQVARALQQAHDAGITHRDLKPENIFLEQGESEGDEIAKVLDFGIAKVRDPAASLSLSSGTKTGILMGTPFYMSPEQARGLKTVDHRSDLWALGVVVFRCVTGVLPFDGESLGDLLVKICANPIRSPSEVLGTSMPQLDTWMHKALDREPDQRYQSAFEMAEALAMVAGISMRLPSRRSADFAPVPTTIVSAGQRSHVEPLGLTPSAPPPSSALAAGLGPALAPAAGRQGHAITSSPFTASAPPPRVGGGVGGFAALAVVALGLAGATTWYVRHSPRPTAAAGPTIPGAASPLPPPAEATVAPRPTPPTPLAPGAAPDAGAAESAQPPQATSATATVHPSAPPKAKKPPPSLPAPPSSSPASGIHAPLPGNDPGF